MTAFQRWLGALLLFLAMPGLFVPGGLDFSVCLCVCGASSELAEPDCCVPASCCSGEEQHGPAITRASASCVGCLAIETQQRDDSTPAKAGHDLPLPPLAPPALTCAFLFENEAWQSRAPHCNEVLAPPPIACYLPLRI